ncbi:MAG: NAD(P)H-binding protein [Anaeromyxobacteraceae bacterium]
MRSPTMPRHVAVIGAAGGLGQGILRVCRGEGVGFTAIVRSRPERIGAVPEGSRVAVVPSLSDQGALTEAFTGADAVLTAMGVTSTSSDRGALLSTNMATVEAAMVAAGTVGRGATELQAVVDALGGGALSSLRWTLAEAHANRFVRGAPLVSRAK